MAEPTNPRWPATKIRDLASSCIIGCGQLCWMLCSFTRFLGRPDKVSSARPCRRRGQDRQPRRGTDRQEAHDHRNAYRKLIIRWSCARSEEHTSELQSLMRISYAVFCLKKKKNTKKRIKTYNPMIY